MRNILIFRIVIIIFLVLFFTACEKESDNLAAKEQLVLQAYLFQNEPVSGIYLSKSLPYESSDTVYTNISDAEISIEWNGINYPLEADTNGLYNYNHEDLQILSGESYTITARYKGKILTSTTKVPEKPTGMTLSSNSLSVNTEFTPFSGTPMESNDIEITWDNPNNEYFYVVIENIEDNPVDIEFSFPRPEGRLNFRFLSQPFRTDRYIIRSMMTIQQYGTHKVKLYKVNEEYAFLYENRTQDSRNLSEPYTNIENGLGIFTAFSYAEAFIEVVKE